MPIPCGAAAPCRPHEEGPAGGLLDEQEVQRLERLAEELLGGLAALRGAPAEGPPCAGGLPAAAIVRAGAARPSLSGGACEPPEARGEQWARPQGKSSHRKEGQMEGCQLPAPGDKGKSEIDDEPRMQTPEERQSAVVSRREKSSKLRRQATEEFVEEVMWSGSCASWRSPSHSHCASIDWQHAMNIIGGTVIVMHMVCIGVSTDYSLIGRKSSLLSGLEHLFLSYYIIELIVHLCVDGYRKCFSDRWFIFDVVLVSMAVLSQWLSPLYVLLSGYDGIAEGLEKTLIVRTLRLVRPLRALRFVEGFKDLWRLVSGMLRSTHTVVNACMLIFVTLYVFALLGVELVRKDEILLEDDMTADLVVRYFDSVLGVFLTLVQFANADSIAALYDPLIRAEPALALYFCAVWIVVTILLMNLVTAVVIQHAIELASEDAEALAREKRTKMVHIVPLLKEAFEKVDVSHDGKLQLDEIKRLCDAPMPPELTDIIQKDTMSDLFRCLDTDETGDVSKDEFVKGMCHIALSTAPIETTHIISMLRVHGKALDRLHLMLTGPPPDQSCLPGQVRELTLESTV